MNVRSPKQYQNIVQRNIARHKREFNAIDRQNQLLVVIAVVVVAIMAVLYFNAIRNYYTVKNCINKDLTYFQTHKCSDVLKVE